VGGGAPAARRIGLPRALVILVGAASLVVTVAGVRAVGDEAPRRKKRRGPRDHEQPAVT
jgi:hypothetical protein